MALFDMFKKNPPEEEVDNLSNTEEENIGVDNNIPMEENTFNLENEEDDERIKLMQELNNVQKEDSDLRTQMLIDKAKLNKFKIKLLKNIYEELAKLGVDFNDISSINKFLQDMERKDPDLVVLFETALNTLTPEENGAVSGAIKEGDGLVGKFSNLQENILRQKNANQEMV